jgi:peptidoglycan/LPS O-acetylase OafA/YrhL
MGRLSASIENVITEVKPLMNLDKIRRITRDGRWVPEIDGLRFIAIMSVVAFHLTGELNARTGRVIPVEPRYHGLFALVRNGDRGVRLFFVISGMILALPFARHLLAQGKKVSLRKYYIRRVTRLEPPYILSVILFVAMIAIYMRGQLPPGYCWHAVASLFYLHGFIYAAGSPVNPVIWSLEVEIQFYILAPLVMQLFRIPGLWMRRVLMVAGILAIGLAQAPVQSNVRLQLSIFFYLQYFLAGLLLADIFVLDQSEMRSSWLWDVAGLAGLIFMFGFGHAQFWAHVLLPFGLAVICLASMRSLVLRRFVANPWIAVIGGACYSVYLMHFALMAAIFKVTRRLVVVRFDFLGNFLIQCLVTGVPILLLSLAYYLLVERPCMDPEWPSKLWHWATRRSGREVEALDAVGISDDAPTVKP